MKNLALDIWDDLRAKRLWPVAAVLLLAMIAIPVFLMKPAEAPAPEASQIQRQPSAAKPAVSVVDDASRGSSNLGVFGKKDPFRPPAATLKPSTSSATAVGASTAGPSASPAPSSGSTGSGSPAVSTGGSGGSGSTRSVPAAPPVLRRPKTVPRTAYTYVIDVDFGPRANVRRRRGVPRLTVLPKERNPVIVFLGVSANAKRAVFLLNPSLKQRGQGTCRPSRARCTFLHLSADPARNGHYVEGADGITYLLRLKAIRRVTVRDASRSASRGPQARTGNIGTGSSSVVFADEQR